MRPPLRDLLGSTSVRLRSGLGAPTVLVGVLGGLVGAAYVGLLNVLSAALGPDHHSSSTQLAILVAVGAAIALITRYGGETGSVELLVDNIHVVGGARGVRGLGSLIPSSLLCVAAGSAMGPEAPLVQTTGTVGTIVASRLQRPMVDTRILTITGMAAGFTVLFGAPLGSAFFALEILHRRGLQYYEALVPAIVGSLCGYGIYLGLSGLGIGPVWSFDDFGPLGPSDLAIAGVLGLIGALGAWIFTATVGAMRGAVAHLPDAARYVAGGLILGLLGIWSPYALTFGEAQLETLVDARLAASALAVAVAAKFLGTTVVLATGWKGGFIIPLFFIGAAAGQLMHIAMPGIDPTVLMACAMVALCVGVTKTPIGATLVVTEMAGLSLLPVTLIAAVIALLASSQVRLIETQRPRQQVEPGAPSEADGR